ncbi:MAG TPA: TRAP transporter fused permease subunit, partial [Rubrivivax sp.]|nr:TRAP transporter fused permease subunit [Rubrivivax sp.]
MSQNDSPATEAVDEKKIKELLEKDAKSGRRVTGPWLWLTSALSATMVLLYFYGAGFQALGTQYHLGIYVLITFVLVFLLYPAGGRLALGFMAFGAALLVAVGGTAFMFFDGPTAFYDQITALRETWEYDGLAKAVESDLGRLWWVGVLILPLFAVLLPLDQWLARRYPHAPTASDVIMAAVMAGAVLYWMSQFAALNYRAGAENQVDKFVSVIGLVLSLEVCRRVLGWSITIIGLAMIAFGLFGPYLPELLAHRGFTFERLATSLFITTNGVFGVMASVLATYVILFIFFGAFLQKSGAGKFFIELPLAVAGRSVGGPAKVAVISSALFGSVSGSAIANTVSSGAFTIPMMKRAGFKPHVAGAIEPAASIGGMFLPPVMGAGGFLMAELTGIPYSQIMIYSVGPAALYFLGVFMMVHFYARREGLLGAVEEMPP